ncbi:MAG TPA: FUSC family protein [Candidatus Angelobacter sp.]|jgi:uncharacterized membrane protein YccC|nr:FUSC family protein [Candidatus Angelobacter sp.]
MSAAAPRGVSGGRADRRLVALHRAVRAAVVNPATFAVCLLVIRDVQLATFAVFGCFALLVMADFGGPRRQRAAAYLATAGVGVAVIALGTSVSFSAASGAVLMLAVGFVLSFGGVFGGYLAAAQPALLLAFVLAVAIPAPVASIPARLEGWLLAGGVSTLAGVFFWPRFERETLRRGAAEACRAVADLVEALRRDPQPEALQQRADAARRAVQSVRGDYARTSMRPAGPTRRDRAFVELVSQLEQIVRLAERPFHMASPQTRPCLEEGDGLARAVTGALRGSAAVLTGGPPPDLRVVDGAWRTHRVALTQWALDALRNGRPAAEVLQAVDLDHTLRVIAYLTLALGANAVIAAGGTPEQDVALPAAVPRLEGAHGVAVRMWRTVRTHLEPSSPVLHNSLRLAIGLSVSVALARILGVGHAFWVVLGTLSVLRSNALGTGRTTVEALAGTLIGFVGGGLFAVLAGNNSLLMWLALPVALFIAAYSASAIGFVAGQAAFTLTVIVIFNLLSPAGWQVGLVRVEDVALGTGVSVVAGLLLWPRGARRDVARATAGLYNAVAAYLEHAFALLAGDGAGGDIARSRADAVEARARAEEALGLYLNERGAKPLHPETAARLVSAGSQALLGGDLVTTVALDLGYRTGACPEGARATDEQMRSLLARIRELAARLAGDAHAATTPAQPAPDELRHAAAHCMRNAGDDDRMARSAMAVLIAAEWIENLTQLNADLATHIDTATQAASIPWWR